MITISGCRSDIQRSRDRKDPTPQASTWCHPAVHADRNSPRPRKTALLGMVPEPDVTARLDGVTDCSSLSQKFMLCLVAAMSRYQSVHHMLQEIFLRSAGRTEFSHSLVAASSTSSRRPVVSLSLSVCLVGVISFLVRRPQYVVPSS